MFLLRLSRVRFSQRRLDSGKLKINSRSRRILEKFLDRLAHSSSLRCEDSALRRCANSSNAAQSTDNRFRETSKMGLADSTLGL